MRVRVRRPSPAMVVALAALVLSVGGNVTAAVLVTSAEIADNTIRSVDVRDETLKSVDVDNGALTGADLAANTVTGANVAANSLTGADVAANSLTAADVADNSLAGADVADNSLTGADAKDDSITGADVAGNSLAGADVADDSLTGADVNESTLGQVPSAAAATDAQTAANAGALNGLAANQLVRASTTINPIWNDNFNTCAMTTVASASVNAPVNGVLMVWGTIDAARDLDGGTPAVLRSRILVDAAVATATNSIHLEYGGNGESAVGVSGAIPVTAGARTVSLQASECDPSGMAFILDKSITTPFVPFGNTGQQGSLAVGGHGSGRASATQPSNE